MQAVHLRPAADNEREAVGAFYWRTWHESHGPRTSAAVTAFRDRAFFVARVKAFPRAPILAERRGGLIGFAATNGNLLDQLFVAAEERSSGVGRLLLAAAEAEIAASGETTARLRCQASNDRARRFYERHGWHVARTVNLDVEAAGGSQPDPFHEMEKALAPG